MVDALDSDEERGKLFTALFDYATDGNKPQLSGGTNIAFIVMSQQIERDGVKWEQTCIRRSENARKRWEAKNANASTCFGADARQNDTVTETEKDTRTVTETGRETVTDTETNAASPPSSPPPRSSYGEYHNVLLSDEELSKLRKELGDSCEKLINKLSSYMVSTGKTYKSHYAVIRRWFSEDRAKALQQPSQATHTQGRDTRSIFEVIKNDNNA